MKVPLSAFTPATPKGRRGIHAAVIGYADNGNDRLLHSGEITRYLERPRLHLTEIIPGKDRKDGKA